MLLIKAYYFIFAAFIFSIAWLCVTLRWLNRLLLEGTGDLSFRQRKTLVPTLRWHSHRPVLENFFRLRFRNQSA